MADDLLLVDKQDGVALVTINRPQALNALNQELLERLLGYFDRVGADDSVRVVILTGAGEKAFVAGGDIALMQPLGAPVAREMALKAHDALNAIEACPKPVIAAINGYALGGGCELALACDIHIASDQARLGQPEINLGIIPGWQGTQRLTRLVGKGRAKELIYTGEIITAEEACRIGLVNQVVPGETLLAAAREMAILIASKSLAALQLAKQAIDNGLEMDSQKAYLYEADLFGLCFATADQKEGMAAFLEKRKPRFRDC
jgi:enoyl-CoA hydratase